MKKLSAFCIFIIVAINIFAGSVTRTYTIANPEITVQGDFQSIFFEGSLLTGETGNPALPYFAVSLLLPPGEVATSVKFVGYDEKIIDGEYRIFPYQSSRPLSSTSSEGFTINQDIYGSSENYPVQNTGNVSTSFLNGYGIALTTFTPLIYTPSTGKVSYYGRVEIIIETAPDNKAGIALNNLTDSRSSLKRIKNFVHNSQLTDQYTSLNKRSDETYNLLIITPDQFSESFEEFNDMYLSRGIKSVVATVEDISANSTGADLQEKIRNYIIQEYQDSQIEYVLLGGDVEYIPHRGFYCYVQSGSGYTSYDIPADLYYAALDGNWNDDGDNMWGEPDEDDLLPEIAIARYPFSNLSELNSMIHKSVHYQNYPVLGELTNALLAGENLYYGPDTWGRDYLDLLIGERSDNGYTTIGIPETYPTDSLYEFHELWGGIDLMNEINEGKQFVHHAGHANPSYVAHLHTNDITNANFSGVNGIDHNFTLFHTHGCDCGAFDNDDCILEKMVTIDNFAVSVIGNSRYGWFNEGQSEGPAIHLHREMIDALYNDMINHLGLALLECKIQTAPWVEAPGQWEEGALRWNFYDINILGDPVLSVWTAEPIDIEVDYEDELEVGTESTMVTITSGGVPMEDFTCSILYDGILHATGDTDANGNVTLIFDPVVNETCEAMLIVVGYNCLPDTSYINFIAAGTPYVVYNNHVVIDLEGNNNGITDFGESIQLDLSVSNNGVVEATDVIATLSTPDFFVTITDEYEQYGYLSPGDTIMHQEAFAFNVSPLIPDEREIEFSLSCESDGQTWLSDFVIIAYAPTPEIGDMVIDDTGGGNGDNELDPGESATLVVSITNSGGSDCDETQLELTTSEPFITIDQEVMNIGSIASGETIDVEFNVEVDEMIPPGTPVNFNCNLNMCQYLNQKVFGETIGIIIEDFETGDFTSFDWYLNGDQNWTVENIHAYNGDYCSKSGNIQNMESSDLYIQIDVAYDDEISFYRQTSSETGSDYLRFYIDDIMIDEWSGLLGWEIQTFDLDQGPHTLRWSYEKDNNGYDGFDCAWLDDILFPPFTTITGIYTQLPEIDFEIYPNPGTEFISLIFNAETEDADIYIFDIHGRKIKAMLHQTEQKELKISISDIKPGLYFVEVYAGNDKIVRKIIIN